MLLLMALVVCARMFKFHTSKCCGKIDFGPSFTKQQALVFTPTTTSNSNYFMVHKCQSPLEPKINIPTLVWLTGSPTKLTKVLKLPQKSHTDRKSNYRSKNISSMKLPGLKTKHLHRWQWTHTMLTNLQLQQCVRSCSHTLTVRIPNQLQK